MFANEAELIPCFTRLLSLMACSCESRVGLSALKRRPIGIFSPHSCALVKAIKSIAPEIMGALGGLSNAGDNDNLFGPFVQLNKGVLQGLQDREIPASGAPCYGVIAVIIFQGNHCILHTSYATRVSGVS